MKTRKGKDCHEKRALELADEALHLVTTAPLHVTAAYYIGSIPFILGFLYFCSDMARSAFAAERCVAGSLGMAVLFVWMKCWQTVFADGLKAVFTHTPKARWTPGRILRLLVVQTVIQPSGVLAIPGALLLMAPFYAIYSFYQNVTLMADGQTTDVKALAGRAWRQAQLWPSQNHILMWLFSPWILATGLLVAFGSLWLVLSLVPELHEVHSVLWFALAVLIVLQFVLPLAPLGCVVAGNVGVVIVLLPSLLKFLFGIETVFTLSGSHAIMNTTFLLTVYGISYLCLDPLMKAAYVLRCFYGESQRTGEDLLVELRNVESGTK